VFSSRRRHTRFSRDWSSDVCSSDLLLTETRRRLEEAKPADVAAVRALDHPVVAFSERLREADAALRAFLHEHMYRHDRVNRMTRSEERRVGKEWRTRRDPEHSTNQE